MPRIILILTILFTLTLPTLAGPETADQVRERRAKQKLEENKRNQARQARSRELGERPEIDQSLVEDFTEMLDIIADPSMEGRVPGSRGIEDAAQYIESHLTKLGLTPAFPITEQAQDGTEVITPFSTFRQPMQMGTTSTATTQILTVAETTFTPDIDFSPLAYSGSADISAPVTFAGYAIVSGPNNYLGFETSESLKDRIALVLNYEPMNPDGSSQWRDEKWSHNARLTYKVTALQRRGAAAVIIVSPPNANDEKVDLLETIASTSPPPSRMGKQTGPQYDIPVIHVTPDTARAILDYTQQGAPTNHSLEDLIDQANQAGIVLPLGDNKISLNIEIQRTPMWTSNIGAILPGKGALKDEFVVIGAHYDHLGYGKFGARTPANRGKIHPGADDNATGTTANILAAKTLTQRNQLLAESQDARSILFLWFTAEESGLNGSRFYTQNPIAPLENHVMMLNMDMIGTLSDGLLEIGGFNSAKGFEELATPHLKAAAIPYSEDVSVGSGRSDHASFEAVGIPNLFFFTGLHERYHTPEDTTDYIDHEGVVRIALLVSAMAHDAATRPDRLYHPSSKQPKPEKTGPNVRIGIIPANSAKGGMEVQRVFENTSASAAGLKPNDRIIKWNGENLDSVEAWLPILTAQEPGDTVTLTIIRNSETIELEMTLRPIE